MCVCVVTVAAHSSHRAVESLEEMISKMLQYIEDVLVGPAQYLVMCLMGHFPAVISQADRVAPDGRVGRMLTETLSRVPKFDEPKFETMLNSAMQVGMSGGEGVLSKGLLLLGLTDGGVSGQSDQDSSGTGGETVSAAFLMAAAGQPGFCIIATQLSCDTHDQEFVQKKRLFYYRKIFQLFS